MKSNVWLKAAAIAQLITGIIHTSGIFLTPPPATDAEKQLVELMTSTKFDLGLGFFPSMDDLTLAFNICTSLLLFMSGSLNWFLVKKVDAPEILKGVVLINLMIYAIAFVTLSVLTFIIPIICMGLIFVFLVLAYFKVNEVKANK